MSEANKRRAIKQGRKVIDLLEADTFEQLLAVNQALRVKLQMRHTAIIDRMATAALHDLDCNPAFCALDEDEDLLVYEDMLAHLDQSDANLRTLALSRNHE